MNNTAEYEALVLGLHKAIDLNVSILIVVGDSKITVSQVHNTKHYVSPHLNSYQQKVWWLISHFQTFNIILVPRMFSEATDALENIAARMSPLMDNFSFKFFYKSSVPDNITNLRIFDDHQ